jgi:hypothetical protein
MDNFTSKVHKFGNTDFIYIVNNCSINSDSLYKELIPHNCYSQY